jgi:hypothetical protein
VSNERWLEKPEWIVRRLRPSVVPQSWSVETVSSSQGSLTSASISAASDSGTPNSSLQNATSKRYGTAQQRRRSERTMEKGVPRRGGFIDIILRRRAIPSV